MSTNNYPVHYVPLGDVLPIFWSTYTLTGGTVGSSVTITGLAVTDIEIYRDGSATQRSTDNGYTLLGANNGIDFDGITGIHGISIDTGNSTADSGFWRVGSWYHVVVSSITIASQTVNFIAACFRIMEPETVPGVPKVDSSYWAGGGVPTPVTAGVPMVDWTYLLGNKVDRPTIPGVPNVSFKYIKDDPLKRDSTKTTNYGGTGS